MVYITLEELEKILPEILDQWIDKDDESWEWIFQEIEQKCYIGNHCKGKKWRKKLDSMVNAHSTVLSAYRNDINELNKKVDELRKYATNNLSSRINSLSNDVEAAKSMAETAKRRTEVNYSKYSGKSDGKVSYSEEAKKLNEELNSMTSNDIAQWCKEQNSKNLQSCTTCKHYCGDGVIKEPCVGCEDYYCWEEKDE